MDVKDPDFSMPTCLVCLVNNTNQEMSSILDVDLDDLFIYEKIEQCAGIEVLRCQNLPTFICDSCYGLLKMAYEFRVTCRNSDEFLKKYFSALIKGADIQQSVEQNPLSIEEGSTSQTKKRSKTKTKNNPIPDFIKNEIIIPPDDSSTNFDEDFIDNALMADNFKNNDSNIVSSDINNHNDENNIPTCKDMEEIILDIKIEDEKPPRIKNTNKQRKSPNSKGKKSTKKARSKVLTDCKEDNDHEIKEQKTPRPRKEKKEKSPHICEICGNKFPHSYTLKNHIKRHLNEKSFNCEICGYSCHSNMELVRHLRKHTGSKPFKCKYCPRAFGDNSTLIKHERVHRNERPFKCEICGSSFSYQFVLKRHKLVHTGEKRYKCEICGKCFNDRYHLISHLKTIQHRTDPRVETLLINIKENNI